MDEHFLQEDLMESSNEPHLFDKNTDIKSSNKYEEDSSLPLKENKNRRDDNTLLLDHDVDERITSDSTEISGMYTSSMECGSNYDEDIEKDANNSDMNKDNTKNSLQCSNSQNESGQGMFDQPSIISEINLVDDEDSFETCEKVEKLIDISPNKTKSAKDPLQSDEVDKRISVKDLDESNSQDNSASSTPEEKNQSLKSDSSIPALYLLDEKSSDIEQDSVFSGDFSRIPDQILAEQPKPSVTSKSKNNLKGDSKQDLVTNIEEQLKEFEGSDDDDDIEMISEKDDKDTFESMDEEQNVSIDVTKNLAEDIFGDDNERDMKNDNANQTRITRQSLTKINNEKKNVSKDKTKEIFIENKNDENNDSADKVTDKDQQKSKKLNVDDNDQDVCLILGDEESQCSINDANNDGDDKIEENEINSGTEPESDTHVETRDKSHSNRIKIMDKKDLNKTLPLNVPKLTKVRVELRRTIDAKNFPIKKILDESKGIAQKREFIERKQDTSSQKSNQQPATKKQKIIDTGNENEGNNTKNLDTIQNADKNSDKGGANEKILNKDSDVSTDNDDDENDVLNDFEIKELFKNITITKCCKCRRSKLCRFKYRKDSEIRYICELKCLNTFRSATKDKYVLKTKKIYITNIIGRKGQCTKCHINKICRYRYKDIIDDHYTYLCDTRCVNIYITKNIEKFAIKERKFLVDELQNEKYELCIHCNEKKSCKFSFQQDDELLYICSELCFNILSKEEPNKMRLKRRSVRTKSSNTATIELDLTTNLNEPEYKMIARTIDEANLAKIERQNSFIRRCSNCFTIIKITDKLLQWQTLDFCNEQCLGKYQNSNCGFCTTCKKDVIMQNMGKYCVRFGCEIRQFCCSECLESYKKNLKNCIYCQKDLGKNTKDYFLAPVGTEKSFKNVCNQICLRLYEEMIHPKNKIKVGLCPVCNCEKPQNVKMILDKRQLTLCSVPCLSAFKFVNNVSPDQCDLCEKYFERKGNDSFTINHDQKTKIFCSKICFNTYIVQTRKIVQCQWCKVKKYNFDMVHKINGQQYYMLCSLNCLTLLGVSMNAMTMRKLNCDQCLTQSTPQYHLTMSDATIRNFCTYQCVMKFQSQFGRTPIGFANNTNTNTNISNKINVHQNVDKQQSSDNIDNILPFPTGQPKRIQTKSNGNELIEKKSTENVLPVISSVTSLANKIIIDDTFSNKKKAKVYHKAVEAETNITQNEENLSNPNTTTLNKNTIITRRSAISTTPSTPSGYLLKAKTLAKPTNLRQEKSDTKTLAKDNETIIFKPIQQMQPIITKIMATVHTQTNNKLYKNASINTDLNQEFSNSSKKAEYNTQIITVPPIPVKLKNKQTMCKPMFGDEKRSHPSTKTIETQTEPDSNPRGVIPIPVPIYIPMPMYMYSAPFPVPVPFPLPIPIPIFIPTTKNSTNDILTEIKRINEKIPRDPFEAELLMMAEMVALEKKESDIESQAEQINNDEEYEAIGSTVEQSNNTTNNLGEDVLQMALKLATEYDEPNVDIENEMNTNQIIETVNASYITTEDQVVSSSDDLGQHEMLLIDPDSQQVFSSHIVKRPISPTNIQSVTSNTTSPLKRRFSDNDRIKQDKPDEKLCLKYTFGVNAWKQWVMTKNADLEKNSYKRKPFKTELLQLNAEELNQSLSLFVKEVRKPNGTEYAPDTIYYLVLGIQQYLYENGRIDNIFTDMYYEEFTDCLHEIAKKFSILYNDSQYIVTRVEEEHLWECQQLGAHSPHVLLSTLMFFNTKYFNLTTVEDHMQLSFSHIMKHWKRGPGGNRATGSRNVLLRFYPPHTDNADPKRKKVLEQQENEKIPLRCPVKLYEFYLSKCPESVKSRNDVFYLMPERSCVPDSPVWYSTQALAYNTLSKMLHRVKMVKEINIALLTSLEE